MRRSRTPNYLILLVAWWFGLSFLGVDVGGYFLDVANWFVALADDATTFAADSTHVLGEGFNSIPLAAVAAAAVGGSVFVGIQAMSEARYRLRRAVREEIDEPRARILDDDEFAKVVAELATPEPEQPARCPDPIDRVFTDGAWSAWEQRQIHPYSNGSPALSRSFTLRADCRAGHVGEHHVGTSWVTPSGAQRVERVCRFLCHSTWSEIV